MSTTDCPNIEKISQKLIDDISSLSSNYSLIAFNNDITPYMWVVACLQKQVPMEYKEAMNKAENIHKHGSDVVYQGDYAECFRIAQALSIIKVETKIEENV